MLDVHVAVALLECYVVCHLAVALLECHVVHNGVESERYVAVAAPPPCSVVVALIHVVHHALNQVLQGGGCSADSCGARLFGLWL